MVTDRDVKKAAKAAKLSILLIIFGVVFMLSSLFYAAHMMSLIAGIEPK